MKVWMPKLPQTTNRLMQTDIKLRDMRERRERDARTQVRARVCDAGCEECVLKGCLCAQVTTASKPFDLTTVGLATLQLKYFFLLKIFIFAST